MCVDPNYELERQSMEEFFGNYPMIDKAEVVELANRMKHHIARGKAFRVVMGYVVYAINKRGCHAIPLRDIKEGFTMKRFRLSEAKKIKIENPSCPIITPKTVLEQRCFLPEFKELLIEAYMNIMVDTEGRYFHNPHAAAAAIEYLVYFLHGERITQMELSYHHNTTTSTIRTIYRKLMEESEYIKMLREQLEVSQ